MRMRHLFILITYIDVRVKNSEGFVGESDWETLCK
jgi:hypothetical protein